MPSPLSGSTGFVKMRATEENGVPTLDDKTPDKMRSAEQKSPLPMDDVRVI